MYISGFSIRGPNFSNTHDFFINLRDGIDMTSISKRYSLNYKNLPLRSGCLKQINKFDNLFFNFNSKQADKLDIGIRILLEVTHEAIMDSKIRLSELNNSKTGVYIGQCFDDYFSRAGFDEDINGYEVVNGARAMAANKISFFYNLKGPSMVIDSACSSSMVALNCAINDIKNKVIDRAIVGGVSITINPNINSMFNQFTMLSPDGKCYSFDSRANGYCRSEGIGVIIIESDEVCNYGYSKILGISVNNDGYKDNGITFPSGEVQSINNLQAFNSSCIHPDSISYIEAHGTGTLAGDSQELDGLMKTFYSNNNIPKRFKLGSVKSNMGHAEAASGIMSLIKCLLMFEKRKIFPNLNYKSTKHEQIINNYFTITDKLEPWIPGNICINNFGFGGTNASIIIGPGNIKYENKISQTQLSFGFNHQISPFFDDQIYLGNDKLFNFRNGKTSKTSSKIAFIYGGQGSQWNQMGQLLINSNQIFKSTIIRLNSYLPNDSNINLVDLYENGSMWMNKTFTTLGICSYQIAITNILSHHNILPDFYLGHSLGEIAAGYANNLQSEYETINLAYIRSILSLKLRPKSKIIKTKSLLDLESVIEYNNYYYYYLDYISEDKITTIDYKIYDLDGQMSAVGVSASLLQDSIDNLGLVETCIACYNSPNGQTVSGPKIEINKLYNYLNNKIDNLFWRDIDTDNIAYHAPHLECYFDWLVNKFESIFKGREITLDNKWIPTNIIDQNSLLNAQFHARNITCPVYFQQAIELLPSKTLVIEIGPSSSLLSQIKRIRSDLKTVNLIKIKDISSEEIFCNFNLLKNIFWENGFNIFKDKIVNLEFRLPLEERYIDIWDHSKDQRVLTYQDFDLTKSTSKKNYYDLKKDKYLFDHQIAGKFIFPASGHILTIWKHIGMDKNIRLSEYEILKAVFISHSDTKLIFDIIEMDNYIAIKYNEDIVAKAKVEISNDHIDFCPESNIEEAIPGYQFYNHLKRYGYEYQTEFKLIENKGKNFALVKETSYMVAYLDNMLQLFLGVYDNNYEITMLKLPTIIKDIYLNRDLINNIREKTFVKIDNLISTVEGPNFRIQGVFTSPISPVSFPTLIHQSYEFIEFKNYYCQDHIDKQKYDIIINYIRHCLISYLSPNLLYSFPYLNNILSLAKDNIFEDDKSIINNFNNYVKDYSDISFKFLNDIVSNIDNLIIHNSCTIHNHNLFKEFIISNFITNFKNEYILNISSLVKQEFTEKKINIFEIGSGIYQFSSKIIDYLDNQISSYIVSDLKSKLIPPELIKYNISSIEYDFNHKLNQKFDLIIASHCLYLSENIKLTLINLKDSLEENGFILIQELISDFPYYIWGVDKHLFEGKINKKINGWIPFKDWETLINSIPELDIIISYYNDYNAIILIKKKNNYYYHLIKNYDQINLQQYQIFNSIGSFGLVKTLKLENDNRNLKALNTDTSIYLSDLNQNLLKLNFNCIQKGKIGTIISKPINDLQYINLNTSLITNYELSIDKPGDLSSLTYIQAKKYNCQVFFSSLNFKDIMYSFGKINLEKPGFGFEFSGKSSTGKNIMGIANTCCLSKYVNPDITWEVPDYLNLQEASTIPVVYLTVLYSLFEKARLEKGQAILIHAGSGGIGMAAIHLCLKRNIRIFTTCSIEKKKYLIEKFNLMEWQICNSRDTTFKNHILRYTMGKGVDCVLNSLSGDLLNSSLDILKPYGSFCEIGKYDLQNNTKLGIKVFENNISYHAIEISTMFNHPILSHKLKLLLQESLDLKEIIPIPYTVFNDDQIESAIRFMSSGKHKGKVIIDQMSNMYSGKIKKKFITSGTHIIIGGLGGIGLELAFWLLEHHAEKVICTSRNGIKTIWQKYRYSKIWYKYPNQIEISNLNIINQLDCQQLLNTPNLKGIYHTAMVLKDSLFENMKLKYWTEVWESKVAGLENIDFFLRENTIIEDNLQVLVVFSSVSSLFGNIGQSNYACANNACESIITQRNLDLLKGVAIQWGAIDNVGILSDKSNIDKFNLDLAPQNIDLSLTSLEYLLELRGVYSSFLRKENKLENIDQISLQGMKSKICQILGGTEKEYLIDHPIFEYGLDSLSTIEIINWINRYLKKKIKSSFITKTITIEEIYKYILDNQ